jgi:zinc transport system substrate-binding protein
VESGFAVRRPLISGNHAKVVFPATPDTDPAFRQPDTESISDFEQAELILWNGAGYAKWISRVSLPRRKVVDTSAGFRERYISTEGGMAHSHGREGTHSHEGTAFTTWLDFTQAVEQARSIRDALVHLLPSRRETFKANFSALQRDLMDLDSRLTAIASSEPEKPLFASHPVYQYLARRYGLNLKSVMWEPDSVAPVDEWQALARLGNDHPAEWMLWEDHPSSGNLKRLQELDIKSLVFNPCGNRVAGENFLDVMNKNIANLEQVFR